MISAPRDLAIYVVQYSEEYAPSSPKKKNVLGGRIVKYIRNNSKQSKASS